MEPNVSLDGKYVISSNVVAREIANDIVIVPLSGDVAALDEQLYSLNETGTEIWKRLSENASLREIVQSLADQYDVSEDVLIEDVIGLVSELLKRGIVTDAPV